MEKSFFTTGQFAKLCKTTKETLRHYNNIGLLIPETTSENGYKHYSFGQMFQFYYIETLKDAGCSLQVIKDSIDSKGGRDFKEILLNQLDSLMIEKKKIEVREKAIRESIKRYDCLNDYEEVNTFYIREDDEQYFIVVPIEDINDYKSFGDILDNHLTYCEEHNIDIPYQFSYISLQYKLEDEKEYFGSIVDIKINSDRLLIKPKGRYLKYVQKGDCDYDKLYKIILEYAEENKLKLSSDIYESEINVYGGPKEDYITEVSIRIM